MMLSWEILLMLFAVATLAGFIDAMAGGGGLLTIPALLAAGIPPAAVLGTNKLQAVGGSLAAAFYFVRSGQLDWRSIKWLIAAAFFGSVSGALWIQGLDAAFLKKLLPVMIVLIGLYFLFAPNLGSGSGKARLGYTAFALSAALPLGFYDGAFGPGVGSMLLLAFVALQGLDLINAVARAKALNAASNLGALLCFIIGGAVWWQVGLVMLAGQLLGGHFGAKAVVGSGRKLIRPLVAVMSFVMAAKMLWEQGGWN